MEQINYVNNDERSMAMLCHLSALAMFIIPFGSILGPLIVWLSRRDQYAEVERQGKDALNFHLSLLLYTFTAGILVILVIGIPILIAIGILKLVVVIVASVKANNGERFTYPLAIRFIA